MSVQGEINRIQQNITNSFNEVSLYGVDIEDSDTSNELPLRISQIGEKIPTKVSQLENDEQYISEKPIYDWDFNYEYPGTTAVSSCTVAVFRIKPNTEYEPCSFRLKITTNADRTKVGSTSWSTTTEQYMTGDFQYEVMLSRTSGSILGWWSVNKMYSISYRPFYYLTVYRGKNKDLGYIVCLRFRDAYNYNTKNYGRDVHVELMNYQGGTIETSFVSKTGSSDVETPAVWDVEGFDYYTSATSDGAGARSNYPTEHNLSVNNGHYQNGDANTYDRLLLSSNIPYVSKYSRVCYGIMAYDKDGGIANLALYGTTYGTTCAAENASTKRTFNTEIGFDISKGLFANFSSGNYAVSTDSKKTYTTSPWAYESYCAMDMRYNDNIVLNASSSRQYTSCNLTYQDGKYVYYRGVIKEDGLFYIRPYSAVPCIFNCYRNSNGKMYREPSYSNYMGTLSTSYLYRDIPTGKYYKCTATSSGGTFSEITQSQVDSWAYKYKRCTTQTIPETVEYDEDGYQYVYWTIGMAAYNSSYLDNTYTCTLSATNPVMWYHNGNIEQYQGYSIQNRLNTLTDDYIKSLSWNSDVIQLLKQILQQAIYQTDQSSNIDNLIAAITNNNEVD